MGYLYKVVITLLFLRLMAKPAQLKSPRVIFKFNCRYFPPWSTGTYGSKKHVFSIFQLQKFCLVLFSFLIVEKSFLFCEGIEKWSKQCENSLILCIKFDVFFVCAAFHLSLSLKKG